MTILPEIPRTAFISLAEDEELYLQQDGKGLALTAWERWKVGVCNYFQSEKTVAMKQRNVVLAYLEAVRNDAGMEAAYFAGRKYDAIVDEFRTKTGNASAHPPVTRRLISDLDNQVTDSVTSRKDSVDTTIDSAAHRASAPWNTFIIAFQRNPPVPTLTDIVNPMVDEMKAEAEQKGLPQSTIDAIARNRVDYKTLGTGHIKIPGISDAIENAILAEAHKDPDRISVVPPLDACTIGQKAVKRFLTRKINELTYDNLVSEVTTAQALTARQAVHDPEDKVKTLVTPEQIEIEVRNAIGNTPKLLWDFEIPTLRDKVIDLALDPESEEKRKELARFYVPRTKTGKALPPGMEEFDNSQPNPRGIAPAEQPQNPQPHSPDKLS